MVAGVRRSKSSVSVSQDAVFNHSIVALQQEPTDCVPTNEEGRWPLWHPSILHCIANCDTPPLHCSDLRFVSQSNYQISILILDCNYFIALVCGLWGHWLNLRIICPILQHFQKISSSCVRVGRRMPSHRGIRHTGVVGWNTRVVGWNSLGQVSGRQPGSTRCCLWHIGYVDLSYLHHYLPCWLSVVFFLSAVMTGPGETEGNCYRLKLWATSVMVGQLERQPPALGVETTLSGNRQ